jgi:hypothetical protein
MICIRSLRRAAWILGRSLPTSAAALIPALVTLLVYPVARHLMTDDGGAFVVAFMAGYGTFTWINLPSMVQSEAASVFGSEAAVIIPLMLIAALVGLGEPKDCMRVFTVIAAARALILADDLRRGRFDLVQRTYSAPEYRASDALLTKVLCVWCGVIVALVEGVIASNSMPVWLAFAALANSAFGIVERAIALTIQLQRKAV